MKCSSPLKCQKKEKKTHSFVTCLPRLMLCSTLLLFDFLTTLTCQFPLLLEMLIGRWTLRLIIYSSSPLAIISCFFFFLLHSWSLQPPPPPTSLLSPVPFHVFLSLHFNLPHTTSSFLLHFLLCFSIQLPHSVILLLSLPPYASVCLLVLFFHPSFFCSMCLASLVWRFLSFIF